MRSRRESYDHDRPVKGGIGHGKDDATGQASGDGSAEFGFVNDVDTTSMDWASTLMQSSGVFETCVHMVGRLAGRHSYCTNRGIWTSAEPAPAWSARTVKQRSCTASIQGVQQVTTGRSSVQPRQRPVRHGYFGH